MISIFESAKIIIYTHNTQSFSAVYAKKPKTLAFDIFYMYFCIGFDDDEGLASPSFLFIHIIHQKLKFSYMIERQQVIDLTNEWLADKEYFLVDVVISKDDKITVEIDHAEGVWIEDCAELSRYIESKLNGAADDYELEVGSAGLGQPFKVIQQYKNHLGLDVEVLTKEGKKLKGILKDANDYDFALTITKKEKVEGAKRPQIVEEELRFTYDSVKYTKYIINFK